jgi:hypothetical protein
MILTFYRTRKCFLRVCLPLNGISLTRKGSAFSREGMVPTIGHLQRLDAAGVKFHSYTEPMLSTDNEMIAVLSEPTIMSSCDARFRSSPPRDSRLP